MTRTSRLYQQRSSKCRHQNLNAKSSKSTRIWKTRYVPAAVCNMDHIFADSFHATGEFLLLVSFFFLFSLTSKFQAHSLGLGVYGSTKFRIHESGGSWGGYGGLHSWRIGVRLSACSWVNRHELRSVLTSKNPQFIGNPKKFQNGVNVVTTRT